MMDSDNQSRHVATNFTPTRRTAPRHDEEDEGEITLVEGITQRIDFEVHREVGGRSVQTHPSIETMDMCDDASQWTC